MGSREWGRAWEYHEWLHLGWWTMYACFDLRPMLDGLMSRLDVHNGNARKHHLYGMKIMRVKQKP
jgi:hypothetical protein